MRHVLSILSVLLLGSLLSPIVAAQEAGLPPVSFDDEAPVPKKPEYRGIEIAFLLDCSGSTSNGMSEVKGKAVEIVRAYRKQYPDAEIRVGLIRYGDGKDRYSLFDLSSNQDQRLRALMDTANAGTSQEFVGTFLQMAARKFSWSSDPSVLRQIYVMGNETPRQGNVDFRQAVQEAVAKSLHVNAVYLIPDTVYQTLQNLPALDQRREVAQLTQEWQEMAARGNGEFILLPMRSWNPSLAQKNWWNATVRSRTGTFGTRNELLQALQNKRALRASGQSSAGRLRR